MHKLTTGLSNTAKKFEIPLQADGQGAMFGCFFGTQCVENFEHAKKTETLSFQQFFYNMLEQKIYWPPSAYEAAFLSLSHSSTIIDKILEASSIAFERLSR